MRLIDADAIKMKMEPCKNIAESLTDYEQGYLDSRNVMLDMIGNSPTFEVDPLRHGQWKMKVIHDTCYFMCSACNSIYNGDTHYCPHCGAKMDGSD